MHDVAILHQILLTFHTQLASLAHSSLAAILDVVVVLDDLGTDESLLEVGMDHTGTLWSLPALAVSPCLHLHRTSGDECLKVEQRIDGLDEAVASALLQSHVLKELHFLTDKKVIYCANVADDNVTGEGNAHVAALKAYADKQGCAMVVICAQMEADLAGLADDEAKEFLQSYGLEQSSLDRTIKLAYETLGLASFLTAGPKEVRAWTFRRGWKAPKCAGVIHTDFEKGFIRAQVVAYEDYIKYGGEAGAREHGVLRPEGKEYEMKDGDVVEFMFN